MMIVHCTESKSLSCGKNYMEPSERKEREKQMRRLHILEAAKEVFDAKGFNRATMEEIAATANRLEKLAEDLKTGRLQVA